MEDRIAPIGVPLERDGFAFVRAPAMRAAVGAAVLADWAGFAASWDALGMDSYMADGGRYRKRRHAAFSASASGWTSPHSLSSTYCREPISRRAWASAASLSR